MTRAPRLRRYKVSLVGVELEAAPAGRAGAPGARRCQRWPGVRLLGHLALLLARWWSLPWSLRGAVALWIAGAAVLLVRLEGAPSWLLAAFGVVWCALAGAVFYCIRNEPCKPH